MQEWQHERMKGCRREGMKLWKREKAENKERSKKKANTKEKQESYKKEKSAFFVVAEIKSVNDQPVEFLEFKKKRFTDENDCRLWMNENSTFVNQSLTIHVLKNKKGYFVDSVKCLKTGHFFPKLERKSIAI